MLVLVLVVAVRREGRLQGRKGFLWAGVTAGQMSPAEPEAQGVAPASGLAVIAVVRREPRFARKPPPERLGRTEPKPGGRVANVSRDPCVAGGSADVSLESNLGPRDACPARSPPS